MKNLPSLSNNEDYDISLPDLHISKEEQTQLENFANQITAEYQENITVASPTEKIIKKILSIPLDEHQDKKAIQEIVISNGLQQATNNLKSYIKHQKKSIDTTTNIQDLDQEDKEEYDEEIEDKNEMLAGTVEELNQKLKNTNKAFLDLQRWINSEKTKEEQRIKAEVQENRKQIFEILEQQKQEILAVVEEDLQATRDELLKIYNGRVEETEKGIKVKISPQIGIGPVSVSFGEVDVTTNIKRFFQRSSKVLSFMKGEKNKRQKVEVVIEEPKNSEENHNETNNNNEPPFNPYADTIQMPEKKEPLSNNTTDMNEDLEYSENAEVIQFEFIESLQEKYGLSSVELEHILRVNNIHTFEKNGRTLVSLKDFAKLMEKNDIQNLQQDGKIGISAEIYPSHETRNNFQTQEPENIDEIISNNFLKICNELEISIHNPSGDLRTPQAIQEDITQAILNHFSISRDTAQEAYGLYQIDTVRHELSPKTLNEFLILAYLSPQGKEARQIEIVQTDFEEDSEVLLAEENEAETLLDIGGLDENTTENQTILSELEFLNTQCLEDETKNCLKKLGLYFEEALELFTQHARSKNMTMPNNLLKITRSVNRFIQRLQKSKIYKKKYFQPLSNRKLPLLLQKLNITEEILRKGYYTYTAGVTQGKDPIIETQLGFARFIHYRPGAFKKYVQEHLPQKSSIKQPTTEYYSVEKVCKELKMEEDELMRLVDEGEIRAFRDEDKLKFKKSDIEGLLRGRKRMSSLENNIQPDISEQRVENLYYKGKDPITKRHTIGKQTMEYYTIEKVCKELQMDEDELKRLVSEGEIRAFRDEDTMKFKKSDIEGLKRGRMSEPTIIMPTRDNYEDDLNSDSEVLLIEENTSETLLDIDDLETHNKVKNNKFTQSLQKIKHLQSKVYQCVENGNIQNDKIFYLNDLQNIYRTINTNFENLNRYESETLLGCFHTIFNILKELQIISEAQHYDMSIISRVYSKQLIKKGVKNMPKFLNNVHDITEKALHYTYTDNINSWYKDLDTFRKNDNIESIKQLKPNLFESVRIISSLKPDAVKKVTIAKALPFLKKMTSYLASTNTHLHTTVEIFQEQEYSTLTQIFEQLEKNTAKNPHNLIILIASFLQFVISRHNESSEFVESKNNEFKKKLEKKGKLSLSSWFGS